MSEDTSKNAIRPLGDRVVLRPLTPEEAGTVSKAGIIIPDTVSQEKPEQGVVVAIGEGRWDESGSKRVPMTVQVGDRVLFSKYGFDEVQVAGEDYIILSEASVLAVVKNA